MLNTEFVSNIIIECPNCETKFSVDPVKLPKSESIKFHCSRCDSNFESNENQGGSGVLNPVSHRPIGSFIKEAFLKNDEPRPLPKSSGKVCSFESINQDPFGKTTASWPEDLKIDKKISSEHLQNITSNSVTNLEITDINPEPLEKNEIKIFLGFPALISLVVLLGVALLDQQTKIFSKLISQNLPKVPPIGIDIVGVKGERIILESGEEVFSISGKVLNASKNSFSSIELETAVYDDSNRQLVRFEIPAINGLQSANIKGLTIRNLEELQNRESNNSLVQASGYQNFQVVVPTPPNDSQWFSIRLKSLKTT